MSKTPLFTSGFARLTRARVLRVTLCLFAALSFARAAAAEPVETIVNNGDPSNRVDIVILGDGYTAAEMSKYRSDIQQFVARVFEQEPFKEYQRFFNVHRIDVASAESGSDHPENGTSRNTAFDSAYNCAGIQRLICANTTKVRNVVNNSLAPAQADLVILIVNDPAYGGSGGSIAIASTDPSAVELILHEAGHTFGLLADEYTQSPPECFTAFEPSEPNVTRETARASIKWNAWIDASTPLPTSSFQPGLVGLYQGARYCTSGLYRPTFNSKMYSLGRPFEQVNSQQLVRRIYDRVSPVDSFAPSSRSLSLTTAQSQTFSVATPAPLTHALSVSWTVNGQPAGDSSSLTVNIGALGAGTHAVEATVRDPSAFVRTDPEQLLTERVTWGLSVTNAAPVNPIDGSEFFVTQHYRDFLNREPDAEGLQFWVGGIESCGADLQCREVKRIDTSAAFFLSIEFQETGFFVYKTHKAAFGNLADKPVPVRRDRFTAETRAIGSGVIVNVGNWREQLEANKSAYVLAVVQRPEFLTAFPDTLTAAQFVGRLFTNANVTPAAGEIDAAVAAFGSGGASGRAAALRSVVESTTLHRAESNRAFVLMQYFGYLQRNPDDAPEQGLNFDGYNHWLSKLEEFGGDYRRAEMVKAFLSSTEYRARFGTP
ncbi:MAG TPA: M64 family metallopeptidase [Pyrinomonadaceae bacterium]|nr:M64 family metallopeptidase [Pyrinomonadaceae bacterium]